MPNIGCSNIMYGFMHFILNLDIKHIFYYGNISAPSDNP